MLLFVCCCIDRYFSFASHKYSINQKKSTIKYLIFIQICVFQKQGLPPLKPRLTFCLETKSKQKIQDCARFARKICVRSAKSSKLASTVSLSLKHSSRLKQGRFLTPLSLIFRLTGRGHSLANLSYLKNLT